MSSGNSDLPGVSSTLQSLLGTLMNSVDDAVRIDDMTALDALLQQTREDGIEDLQGWLIEDEAAARKLRGSITTLAVNEASVELFGAESRQQLVDHMNATQHTVNSPDFMGFVVALRDRAPAFTGTFYRDDMHGQLRSAVVETQFVRSDDRVLACHIIRQSRVVQKLEQQLSRIRQLHSLAVSATDTGCWELSFVDNSLSMDATCHRLFGYTTGELPTTPRDYLPMIHPDDRSTSFAMAKRLFAGESDEYRIENRIQDKSGNWRWFLTHGRAMESLPDGRFARMVGTLRQIDVPRKTEELLRIEKQGLAMQAAKQSLRDTLTVLCLRLEDVWPETRCSINLFDAASRTFHTGAAPSLPAAFSQKVQNFAVDSVNTVCGDAVDSRGTVFASDLLADDRYKEMRDNYLQWGVRRCWSAPAITPDGRLVATLCLFSDSPGPASPEDLQLLEKFAQTLAILILQYEQDEQQKQLELRLQVQDKFQSLGKLAGGIAHDFNNLLTVIAGHGEILQMQLAQNPAAVETTDKILHAVKIATSLCRQMLTFAGKATVQVEPVDINEIATEVCGLMRPGLRDGITLDTTLCSLPTVMQGDRGMLSQIIMNLVSNAADATSENGGHISVTVTADGIDVPRDELVVQDTVAESAHWVCITVRDDGSGISDDIRERIFDPFFTTRESGKGLGLATVMGIIRRHQGAVHVTSQPGDTTFRVFLPLRPNHVAVPSAPWQPESRNDERRRILLTDDDRAVRLSLSGMLQAAGYQIEAFASGDNLLNYTSQITPDDVILLDQNMPGLKGSDTYERLRSEGLLNPVCFVTAFGTEPLQRIIDRDDTCCIVEKPLQISTICDAINRLTARACAS